MDQMLLHVCCGPCSTVAVPHWRAEGLEPVALFVNPNIQPALEFGRRLSAMEQYAEIAGVSLIVDTQLGAGEWAAATGVAGAAAHTTQAPIDRCRACLELRLGAVARATADRGLPRFSTSLTVSPYQRHDLISEVGSEAARRAGVEFLYADLRGSFHASLAESRRQGLYRQRYCGCVPSKWEAWEERLQRRRERRGTAA